jgi:hypothetical protein
MALTTKIELRKEYLYARLEGEFDFQSALVSTDLILEACIQHQSNKILADFRSVIGQMNDNERIHYAELSHEKYQNFLEKGHIKNCRFAWLGKVPLVDPKRLGEAVALNRGMMIRVTTELDQAFVWLGVQPDMR